MINEDELKIQDIFDTNVWQKIQDSFAKATNLAAIIVDKNGIPLLEYSNFSDYCLEIRKTKECDQCIFSDAMGGILASKYKKPVVYQCHGGLVDFAVPIVVGENYLGAILAGQVRLKDEDLKKLDYELIPDSIVRETEIYENSKEMKELYERTPVIEYSRLQAASDLLFTIANYLVEMKIVRQMENQLHEKEIELSEEIRLRSDVEAALREADFKALESQVNPHFLFNVLNTIGRLALLENADRTQEMVYQFSDLMRYTLRKSDSEAVKLTDEIEYARNYLNIQKTRLGDNLKFSIEVEDGCGEVLCPSMIIQPFVENVINHVVEKRSEGGTVSINVKKENKDVIVTIQDNGDGIEPEKVDKLLSGVNSEDGESTGLGVINVNKRLKYYYGTDNGIQIDSVPKKGTRISMRIPADNVQN